MSYMEICTEFSNIFLVHFDIFVKICYIWWVFKKGVVSHLWDYVRHYDFISAYTLKNKTFIHFCIEVFLWRREYGISIVNFRFFVVD